MRSEAVGHTYWCLASNDALPSLRADQPRWRRWAEERNANLRWRGVAAQLAAAERVVTQTAACSLPCMMALAAVATALIAPGSKIDRIRTGMLGAAVSAVPTAVLIMVAAVGSVPLGIPALMIGAIAIGVTVDDTLHLTAAFRRRRSAIRATLECWRPCVGSSIVGASTLAIFALSPFGPTRQFGILMATAVLCGVLSNQLIVLTLVAWRPVIQAADGTRPS
jgi:hypothetical protein